MRRFSILTLAQDTLADKDDWPAFWQNRQPKADYEVIVVGAGGHGLATAYHLARSHGIHDVAVVDKDMLGLSCAPASGLVSAFDAEGALTPLLRLSFERYAELSRALNFNVMFRRQGIVRVAFEDREKDRLERAASLDRLAGRRSRLVTYARARRAVRRLGNLSGAARPPRGAMIRTGEGSVSRTGLLWAYARAADSHGVHMVQNCLVTGLMMRRDRAIGVETDHGPIRAKKVILAAGEATRTLALTADLALPLVARQTHTLISEPVKPVLDMAIVAGDLGLSVHQAHTGEIIIDYCPAEQTGTGETSAVERAAHAFTRLFPSLSGLRLLHHWQASRAETLDGKPILGAARRKGLYLSCGWGNVSLSAVPAAGMALAQAVATDRATPEMLPFAAERFASSNVPAPALAGAR